MNCFATLALFAAMASSASAAIVITGNVNVPGAPCTVTITTDIVFDVQTTGGNNIVAVIFDEWITSDGTRTFPNLSPAFSYQRNDGPVLTATVSQLIDNVADPVGSVSANDGYFYMELASPLTAGETFTLFAGTYNFAGNAEMNPAIVGTFGGSTFLTDGAGKILSPVPETSVAMLGALGLIPLLYRRR